MVVRAGAFTTAALLALATISSADIINLDYAEWSSRGADEDLFRFVTVCYICRLIEHNSAEFLSFNSVQI